MAQPALLHSDQYQLDQAVGDTLQQGVQAGVITDAEVNASTTNAGLRALLASNYAGHADGIPLIAIAQRALDVGLVDTSMSDANVSAATTVALLTANTFASPGKVGPMSLPN